MLTLRGLKGFWRVSLIRGLSKERLEEKACAHACENGEFFRRVDRYSHNTARALIKIMHSLTFSVAAQFRFHIRARAAIQNCLLNFHDS